MEVARHAILCLCASKFVMGRRRQSGVRNLAGSTALQIQTGVSGNVPSISILFLQTWRLDMACPSAPAYGP